MTIREYGSRTAATNFLRGKGVAAADFNHYLKAKGDKFLVNDALIGQPVERVKLPLATNITVVGTDKKPHELHVEVTEVKPAKAAKTGKKTADKKPTAKKPDKPLPISQFCLSMFKAGSDNAEVWAQLQKVYGLDEEKAHYPAWYRSHFRRKGQLPAASVRAK